MANRSYPEETLVVLGLITTAQAAGFSLEEISSIAVRLNHWDRQTLLTTCNKSGGYLKSWNRNSRTVKAQLVNVIHEIQQKPDDIDCAANARRVITEVLDVQHQTGKKNNYQPFTASPLYNSAAALATSSVWYAFTKFFTFSLSLLSSRLAKY